MKQSRRFTPAINNITGKRPQEKNRVRVFIGRGGLKNKPKQRATYKIPKTPKVSGIGWGP